MEIKVLRKRLFIGSVVIAIATFGGTVSAGLAPALVALSKGGDHRAREYLRLTEGRTALPSAKNVEIVLPEGATVADLIRSSKRKHVGFNLPTMPQFTSRAPWSAAPWKMKSYNGHYKLANGTMLTAASMLRFWALSPVLFVEDEKLTSVGYEYRQTLFDVKNAHKVWYANQTVENLKALQALEDKILGYLAQLPLNNSVIRARLEKILSTAKHDHNSSCARAWVEKKPNATSPQKWVVHQNGVVKSFLKRPGVPLAKTAAVAGVEAGIIYALFRSPLGYRFRDCYWRLTSVEVLHGRIGRGILLASAGVGALASASSLLSGCLEWFSDENLTPEPAGGIKVVITLNDDSKALDALEAPVQ